MQSLILPMDDRYADYLSDESKLMGSADSISFPESAADIAGILKELQNTRTSVTVQGGKTGIVGSAVPVKGHIMNLSKMNHIKGFHQNTNGECWITVEAGITLMELKQELKRIREARDYYWPPDPTEGTATVGGVISTNAKGICACLHGDAADYVESIRVILADGEEQLLKDSTIKDYYQGGEGMYGVITEATLCLHKRVEEIWGITFFFHSDEELCQFAEAVKDIPLPDGTVIGAMEYMDRSTIHIIEQYKTTMSKIKDIPAVDEDVKGLVYIEIHSSSEDAIESAAEQMIEIAMDCGSDPDKAWAVSGESEIERMRDYRHGAAEASNLYLEQYRRIDKRLTKLGTDMSLTHGTLSEVLNMYKGDLEKESLQYCVFGHIIGTHLHVNIFPKSYEEYRLGQDIINGWGKTLASRGGCPMTEHGIGKLRMELFAAAADKEYIDGICEGKRELDPDGIWNPDNMIPDSYRLRTAVTC